MISMCNRLHHCIPKASCDDDTPNTKDRLRSTYEWHHQEVNMEQGSGATRTQSFKNTTAANALAVVHNILLNMP